MSEMTAEAWAEAHAAEYSKYVATEAINLGGARAFNIDDPVPRGHVDGYDRPEVVDGEATGKTERVEPVVRLDQVKRVPAAKKAATSATAPKES